MKTKLVVGKEYWLNPEKTEKGKLKSVSSDLRDECSFTFKLSSGGELSFKNMSIPAYVIEVVENKPWSLITPIAMKCTEEQFNGIKDRLVEIGYTPSFITFMSDNRYLCTIGTCSNNHITDYNKHAVETSPIRRIVFETFNPDLFLALAAMTDKEDGIKGEWWKSGLTDRLIIQSELSFSHPILRKATAREIIEHFEKKEEFVLPEKWCIKITDSNFELV